MHLTHHRQQAQCSILYRDGQREMTSTMSYFSSSFFFNLYSVILSSFLSRVPRLEEAVTDVPFFSSSVVAKGPIVFWGSAKPQTLPQALILIAQSSHRTNDSPSRATDVARRRRPITIYDWWRPELRTRAVLLVTKFFPSRFQRIGSHAPHDGS